MTIGPAPMIKMLWISCRFGITRSLSSPGPPTVSRRGYPRRTRHSKPLTKKPSRGGPISAPPAQRALLYRVHEGLSRLHRLDPRFLQPVVPDCRHIRVLD